VEIKLGTHLSNVWKEGQNYVPKMLECEVVKMKV
jgi:hypothetical protein